MEAWVTSNFGENRGTIFLMHRMFDVVAFSFEVWVTLSTENGRVEQEDARKCQNETFLPLLKHALYDRILLGKFCSNSIGSTCGTHNISCIPRTAIVWQREKRRSLVSPLFHRKYWSGCDSNRYMSDEWNHSDIFHFICVVNDESFGSSRPSAKHNQKEKELLQQLSPLGENG